MSSHAKNIRQYLALNSYGVSGVDLFHHKIPGDSEGIAIRDTGGYDADTTLDKTESISRPTIQIFARGSKYGYDDAYNKLEQISEFLDQSHEIEINSKRYISISRTGDILDLGENTSEKPELSVNFMLEVAKI